MPGALNIQGPWALKPDWRSSRSGKTLQELQGEGHQFKIVKDMSKLPLKGGSVDEVITNSTPLDTKTWLGPAPSTKDIKRVLKPDGVWKNNGEVQE